MPLISRSGIVDKGSLVVHMIEGAPALVPERCSWWSALRWSAST